ncbi:MAG: hypothetical protein U0768_09445 [Anaerolineae bacterium]
MAASTADLLSELDQIMDVLPDYLTRGQLYGSIPSTGGGRLSIPVSIGEAMDRFDALKKADDLTPEQKAHLAGLEGRLHALEQIYPDDYKKKLAAEQRSRAYVARANAEDQGER